MTWLSLLCVREHSPSSNSSQKTFRIFQARKQFLLGAKVRRMHTAPSASHLHRMLQMQHFMIDNVFHGVPRNREMVKDAADNDRVVRGIVMAQHVPGSALAPTHARTPQHPLK